MLRRERPCLDFAVIRRHVVIDDPRNGVADASSRAAGGRLLGDRAGAGRGCEGFVTLERRRRVVRLIAELNLRASGRACPPRGGVRYPVGSAGHVRRTCTSRAA